MAQSVHPVDSIPIPPELIQLMGSEDNARALLKSFHVAMEPAIQKLMDAICNPDNLAAMCIAMLESRDWTAAHHLGKAMVVKSFQMKGETFRLPIPLLAAVQQEIEASYQKSMVDAVKKHLDDKARASGKKGTT